VAKAARDELASLKGQTPRIVERRRELTRILTEQSTTTRSTVSVRSDSQAAALGFYIRAAGYKVDDTAVGTWLNLGMVLFLELAAALSMTVATMLYQKPLGRPSAAGNFQATSVSPYGEMGASVEKTGHTHDDDRHDDDQTPPSKGKRGRPATVLPAQAVERLRQKGGKANGSIRGIGKLLGTRSKTTAHRLLHRLASAGLITMAATSAGVSVALT
jgi:hypothetical protein